MSKRLSNYLIPSIADILFMTVFGYISLCVGRELLQDGDTGYHIRVGDVILNNWAIPKQDIFSFITPTLPWTAHEWLAEIVMSLLHKAGGLTAIVLFFALIIATTCYTLFRSMAKVRGNVLVAILITLLFIACAKVHWLARPHVFSMLIYVVWYWLLDRFNRDEKVQLWLFPCIMLVWVNLHGGYIVGFVLLGIDIVGSMLSQLLTDDSREKGLLRTRALRLLKVSFACLATSLINPIGYKILLFPFRLVSDSYVMDHVNEFLAPDFHKLTFFRLLILLVVAVLIFGRDRLTCTESLLLVFFLNMSLYSVRYIPLFALVSLPILIKQLTPHAERLISKSVFLKNRAETILTTDGSAKGIFWPIVTIIVVCTLWINGSVSYGFNPDIKPVHAVNFLQKEKITGNMFNNDEFGDILIYSAYERYKVFIDGRLDMYGAERMKEYSKICNFEQGWEKVLEKYHMTWIFYDADSHLSRYLLQDKRWHLVYADKVANIFVRNIPEYRYLIEKYPNVLPLPKENEHVNAT